MTSNDYVRQLDNILLANGEGLLTDGGSVSHEEAMEKAQKAKRGGTKK